MNDLYFSTGQLAQELNATQAKIRILCETGSIPDAVCTPGGQWRIPKTEVERLKQEGLPPVGRPLPDSEGVLVRSRRSNGVLLAEPSEHVIDAAEQVVVLENEVKAIGLQRQKEEGLDWFRDREEREAIRQAEREEADRQRRAQQEADHQHQLWVATWIEHAFDLIPGDAPQSVRIDVHGGVEQALEGINSNRPDSIVSQLLGATVDRALLPWRKSKQVGEAVRQACENRAVPPDMRQQSDWKLRMREVAAAGVARIQDGGPAELETAASHAIAPLIREYEHELRCQRIVKDVWIQLVRATTEEREQGKEVVHKALAELPIGTSQRELERVRDVALEPIRATIMSREDREIRADLLKWADLHFIGFSEKLKQEAVAEVRRAFNKLPIGTTRAELEKAREEVIQSYGRIRERQRQKQRLIDDGVREIRPYVEKLAQKWDFGKDTTALTQELERPIRTALHDELNGRESLEQISGLVRSLVRDELNLP